ncbi:MAG: hypothetical protein ABSD98_01870 [Candidatus Korobacteraceae bacterium]|jgi:hypothetical protein
MALQAQRDRRAMALPNGYTDLVVLYEEGLVFVEAKGESITEIVAYIQSRVTFPLKVCIPVGTYFVKSGNYQNMVTRAEYKFELPPTPTVYISLKATCINATLPIPTSSDKFRGVARVSEPLSRFLRESAREDDMTIQAGVWAITDGYTRSQVQSGLRKHKRWPLFERPSGIPQLDRILSDDGPAISDLQIDRAKVLLDKLRIGNFL